MLSGMTWVALVALMARVAWVRAYGTRRTWRSGRTGRTGGRTVLLMLPKALRMATGHSRMERSLRRMTRMVHWPCKPPRGS